MNASSTIETPYNNGRKGVSYDWQSLFAASQAAHLEAELAQLDPLSTTSERA